jgi:hypothetical protein
VQRLGVLFDIDELGGGFYGLEAYKILFSAMDTRELAGCLLLDGDTNATLAGKANVYCIAVETLDSSRLVAVRRALSQSTAKGLLPAATRFMEDAPVHNEPLVRAGCVGPSGELVGDDVGWVRQAWEATREFHPGNAQ